jgi:small subunit ribosomal protein S16
MVHGAKPSESEDDNVATTIRLTRMGRKKRPFYRLVVLDSRKRRDGAYLANLGYYNPFTEPHEINLHPAEILSWLEKGATVSDTARSLLRTEGVLYHFSLLKQGMDPAEAEGKVAEWKVGAEANRLKKEEAKEAKAKAKAEAEAQVEKEAAEKEAAEKAVVEAAEKAEKAAAAAAEAAEKAEAEAAEAAEKAEAEAAKAAEEAPAEVAAEEAPAEETVEAAPEAAPEAAAEVAAEETTEEAPAEEATEEEKKDEDK